MGKHTGIQYYCRGIGILAWGGGDASLWPHKREQGNGHFSPQAKMGVRGENDPS